jgi:ubiquinone biosynthesis protein
MLREVRNGARVVATARCLARHNALFPLELLPVPAAMLWAAERVANHSAPGRPGERLARALQELGPAFIKLGQSLAVRGDLLGEAIARDLSELQDRLPSFPADKAKAVVEAQLERPLKQLFASFENEPVAAASISQVHFAVTPEGEEVAVKILRPGIEAAVERDLDFLLWLAEWAERLRPALRRYRPVDSVRMLALTTRREMDLRLEAAAAAEFRTNCAGDEGFKVPRVDWRRTAQRVVTFERVSGLHADEREVLVANGHDPDAILAQAAVVFFNQVFRDGFFHADMHPGNMLIDAEGAIVALDFGIMGRIDLPMRRHLAEILLGFLSRDYERVAAVFFSAGFVPPHQDQPAFQQACRAIGEPILDLPLNEISIGRLLGQLLTVAEQFEMEQQPQLVLLQKTMAVSEGVGRALNPGVNIWQLAQPLVEGWIRANLGPEAQVRRVIGEGLAMLQGLPMLVARIERLARDQEEARAQQPVIVASGSWGWPAIAVAGVGAGLLLGYLIR